MYVYSLCAKGHSKHHHPHPRRAQCPGEPSVMYIADSKQTYLSQHFS